jgi:hypothetical protein
MNIFVTGERVTSAQQRWYVIARAQPAAISWYPLCPLEAE